MPAIANEARDLPLVFETMRNFGGGEDSFRDPVELDQNQCQHLVNIIIQDKLKARTRPGADKLGAADVGRPTAAIQGLLYYDTPSYEQLLVGSNGAVLYWNGSAWATVAGWSLASASARFMGAQGVDMAMFTDGAKLWTWNGAAKTELPDDPSTPPRGCSILCWHAGRMWASGLASAPDTVYASALLNFAAGGWDRTSRSFRIGGGEGDDIVGLASMQQFVLVVLKRDSIWLTVTDPRNVPTDYSANQASDPISDAIGCVGRDAWCKAGNDLMFVSDDGIYRLRRMDAAKDQWELSAPDSLAVQPYIDRINASYAHLISAWNFKEFAFFAVPLDSASYNDHVLVYNRRLGRWLGVWTGWTPVCWAQTRFSGIKRLVFGDHAGDVNQWKIFEDDSTDSTYLDNSVAIACALWGRSMVFGDLDAEKTGFNARVRFNRGNAAVTLSVVGNDVSLRSFEKPLEEQGDILGTDVLPFLLASDAPTLARGSLRGLPAFNELYLKVESTSGWWELRNFSLSARVRPLKNK